MAHDLQYISSYKEVHLRRRTHTAAEGPTIYKSTTAKDAAGAVVEAVGKGLVLAFADLRGLNCEDQNLRRAQLQDTALNGACFKNSDLRGADFSRSDMESGPAYALGGIYLSADLRGAILEDAKFVGAKMKAVDLTGANLTRADLQAADLRNATFGDKAPDGMDMDQYIASIKISAQTKLDGATGIIADKLREYQEPMKQQASQRAVDQDRMLAAILKGRS